MRSFFSCFEYPVLAGSAASRSCACVRTAKATLQWLGSEAVRDRSVSTMGRQDQFEQSAIDLRLSAAISCVILSIVACLNAISQSLATTVPISELTISRSCCASSWSSCVVSITERDRARCCD